MTRTRLYWICQLVGWAVIYGGLFLTASLSGQVVGATDRGSIAVNLALSYVLSICATHAIRIVAIRRGWLERSVVGLGARLAAASVVAATAATVAEKLQRLAAGASLDTMLASPGWLLNGLVSLAAVYLAWSVVYALVVSSYRLGDAEREQLQLRASLAEARMDALERQLNPHFLFNALNTVRALIAEDPAEARRAVTLLSGMLRQTLTSAHDATHALDAELDLVETYLALETLRFGDRVQVCIEASPDARALAVPTLIVQTLVENAVKHGVARCRDGGDVTVAAAVADDRLTVTVTNPSPTASAPTPDGTGTGLANARERLSLLFGDRAHLGLDVGPERTVAQIVLPATLAPALPSHV